MGDWLAPLLSALGVGAMSLFGTWLNARRHRSGSVQTSEAADLWKESSALRQELHKQVGDMRLQMDTMRAENSALQGEVIKVRQLHRDCEERLNEFKKILSERTRPDE